MFKVVWLCGEPFLDLEGVCTITINYVEGRYIFRSHEYANNAKESEGCFQSLMDWVYDKDQFFEDLNDWLS